MEPIIWKEKPGLYAAIIEAGYYVEHTQDGSFADSPAAVQAIIDTFDPLPTLRADLHDAVAAERIRRLIVGAPYTFPDGQLGTIQTRSEQDLLNINGLTTRAMMAAGINDPVFSFRDQENRTHAMTPGQILSLGAAASDHVSALYQAKWQHDEAIDAWDGTTPYDITTGWPG